MDFCLSSCANYVFTAGERKIVSSNAMNGFHGGLKARLCYPVTAGAGIVDLHSLHTRSPGKFAAPHAALATFSGFSEQSSIPK